MIVKLEFLIEVFFSEIIVLEIISIIASVATNFSINKHQVIDYTICDGGRWNTQCMTM